MSTTVYIDGFNLCSGARRKTPGRWVNVDTRCPRLLPSNTLQAIQYCTAWVSARPSDPDQPVRQQLYLRALKTLPKVSMHLGHVLTHEVTMPLVGPPGQPQQDARVITTEEKGADVHLATHLLHDAHMGACEVAVVVSNDSDRLEPITIVRGHLGKNVGVLNPQKHPSRAMLPHIDFIKQIRHGTLHAAQLPATVTDQPRHVYEASRLVTAGRRVPYARFARPHVFLPAAVPAIKGGGGNDSVTHVSASLRSNALWRLSTWGKP